MGFSSRLKHAWNAFQNEAERDFIPAPYAMSAGYSTRPDRTRLRTTNERSIISSIYTRIGIDCASVDMRHVRLDDNGRYSEDIESGLNTCLTLEANIDQAAMAFKLDIVTSMLDKGCVAIVPVDTTISPETSGGFDIKTMRVGEIVQWYPAHVRTNLYNEAKGLRQEIMLGKRAVAVVENPLYAVMNEPNSTLQRLMRKLEYLDIVDKQSSSGKLDLIIQLPYVIKSDARRTQAEQRRKDIEVQLKGSQYGIAYTDGTEKITQLNRPTENNLLNQVEYLTKLLYSQLGITEEVMNGTANEATMLNYYNRTILPILDAVVEAMRRSFLTKTARSQKQSILYFRDPFKLVPISIIAEIADKLARNEVLSSNEIRGTMGFKPSKDPKADQLVNSNMPQPGEAPPASAPPTADPPVSDGSTDEEMNSTFASLNGSLDDMLTQLGES